MSATSTTPAYTKFAQILVGLVAFFFILYIGRPIILPLVFATLIALLLNPLVNYLTNRKMGRVLAITISLLFAMLVIGSIVYFIGSQASKFTDALPLLKVKLHGLLEDLMLWLSQRVNVDRAQLSAWLSQSKNAGLGAGPGMMGQTLGVVSDVLVTLLLLPVYIFLILFYKPLLLEFLGQVFKRDTHSTVAEVLVETKSLVQKYLLGLLIEAVIVATLNTVGLLMIGIPYALLLGTIGALLNMIPYIGGLVAISLPMIMALMTGSNSAVFMVLGLYLFVQFIDNNIIVPRIVASRVKLNALVSIVIVLIGNALWGIPGMFLAIPLTAIVKVIFDRIEQLKPLGFLLGDTMPPIGKTVFNFSKFKRKPKPKPVAEA